MRENLYTILIFSALCLSFLVENNYLIASISLYVLIHGILKFRKEKRELKDAIVYARPIDEFSNLSWKDWKTWKIGVLALASIVAFMITFHYAIEYFNLKEIIAHKTVFLMPIVIGSSFSNYYRSFSASLRAYDDGLKFPGENESLIKWTQIKVFQLKWNHFKIELNEDQKELSVKKEDLDDLRKIHALWETKILDLY